MAEFKLGRIKFVYQGAWTTGTSYVVDDVVTVSGKTYICVLTHTSSALFNTDLTANVPAWNLVADGAKWTGTWATSTYYNAGDLALYGGIVYTCVTPHTSASTTTLGLENDQGKWNAFAANFNWSGAWATSTRYKVQDLVTYGGYTYVCNTAHTSASTTASGLENDQSKWDTFNAGINYKGTWSGSSVRYKVNDIVTYGADLWICTTYHTSSGSTLDATKFSIFVNGFEFENSWNNSTNYVQGDMVTYGGYTYTAIQSNSNQTPSTATAYWQPFTTGMVFAGDWNSSTTYKTGNVVRLGGYTYFATADSSNQVPPNTNYWQVLNTGIKWNPTVSSYTSVAGLNVSSNGSGATFNVTASGTTYTVTPNSSNLGTGYSVNDTIKILGTSIGGLSPANDIAITVTGTSTGAISTISWTGISVTWAVGTNYVNGDVVFFGASSYICVSANVATSLNSPAADTTGTYWNILASGTEQAVLTTQGDMFYYGSNGPTRLPIGTDGQILRVNNNTPTWQYYGQINNVVYVSPTGADVATNGQGTTIDKPWQSIRFACQQVQDGYLNTNAKMLLRLNKQFMMKETSQWVYNNYSFNVTATIASTDGSRPNQITVGSGSFQATTGNMFAGMPITFTSTAGGITANTTYYVLAVVDSTHFTITATSGGSIAVTLTTSSSANTGSFVFSQSKTERDAGLVIEGITHDISRNGNYKTITNTQNYFNSAGTGLVSGVNSYDITPFVGSLNYLSNTLIPAVLGNAPTVYSYQTLNGIALGNQAYQQINISYTAESGTIAASQALISVVTTTLQQGNLNQLPQTRTPATTISVKTGTYNEILPIIVPAYTSLVGDELRTTVVQPASSDPQLATVVPKVQAALTHVKELLPSIVANIPVAVSSGNTTSQVYQTGSFDNLISSSVTTNLGTMTAILNNGLTSVPGSFTITDPIGYDTGYYNARRLIVANKAFIQSELVAFVNYNFVNFNSNYNATTCARDIGLIIDAVCNDVITGSNFASSVAGEAYYRIQSANVTSLQMIQTLDAITYASNLALTYVDSSLQSTFQAAFTNVYNILQNGLSAKPTYTWPSNGTSTATTVADAARIQSNRASIITGISSWMSSNYSSLWSTINQATCQRDVGYILDAITYDLQYGGTYQSNVAGSAYYSYSTLEIASNEKTAAVASIGQIGTLIKALSGFTSGSTVDTLTTLISGIISTGTIPSITYPSITNETSVKQSSYTALESAKATIKSSVTTYITNTYSSLSYNTTTCQRDIGYIVDALNFDLTYGCNLATVIAARSYYSNGTFVEYSAEKKAALATQKYLASIISNIAQGIAITKTSGNAASQVTSGTAGSSTAGSFAVTRINEIYNTINTGVAPSTVAPDLGWVSFTVINAFNEIQSAKSSIQASIISWINTNYPSLSYNVSTCSRDIGYIVDALSYDAMLGSNFLSCWNAMSYYRSLTSTGIVRANQLAATVGSVTQTANLVISFATDTDTLSSNLSTMTRILTNGLSASPGLSDSEVEGAEVSELEGYTLPQPTSGSYGYTSGYYNASRLIYLNKTFLQAEVAAYMAANYSSVWSGLGSTNQAACTRDIGYIVDALRFDLMYGGNLATVIAARSYYSNGTFVEASGEKTAALAVQTYLASIISNIAQGTAITPTSGNTQTQVTSGTAGSSTAGTYAAARITEIYNTINTGTAPTTIAADISWVSATLTGYNTAIRSATTQIQTGVIAWINNTYPNLAYNVTTCSRDVGYIIDALCYDMMFGSNFLSSWNAMSYYRSLTSTGVVTTYQLQASIGTVAYIGASMKQIAGGGIGSIGSFTAVNTLTSSFATLYRIVASGTLAEPPIVNPAPTGFNTSTLTNTAYATTTGSNSTGDTTGYGYGVTLIQNNYAFIQAELMAYLSANYSAVYSSESATNIGKGFRDIAYILDSVCWDMTYGGNYQSNIAGGSYYSLYILQLTASEQTAFAGALGRLKSIISNIVQATSVSVTSGNSLTQYSGGTAGSAAAAGFAQDRVQNVINYLSNGASDASISPCLTSATSDLQTAYADLISKQSEIQSDAVVWCQKFYQSVTFSTTLASRDAGLVIQGIAYDVLTGSNFNAIQCGRAYCRANTSATTLRSGNELAPTLGAINFMMYKAKNIAAGGGLVQIHTTIDDINNYMDGGAEPLFTTLPHPALPIATYTSVSGTTLSGGGSSAVFTISRWSNSNGVYGYTVTPTTPGSSYTTSSKIKILGTAIGGASPVNDVVLNVTQVSAGAILAVTVSTPHLAVAMIEANRNFILAEVVAYMDTNYLSITRNPNYSASSTKRDAGYILDAIKYDMLYGGNWQSQVAGMAYYSALYGTEISSGFSTAIINTVGYISTMVQSIITGTTIGSPVQSIVTQVTQLPEGVTGAAKDATQAAALITIITNFITYGLTSGAPVATVTTIASGTTFTTQSAHGLSVGDIVIPQTTSNGLVSTVIGSGTVYYVASTPLSTTFTLAASYGGAAITSFTSGTGLSIAVQTINMPNLGWVNATTIAALTAVSAAIPTYQTSVVSYLNTNYSALTYSSTYAQRDAYVVTLAAIMDMAIGSNFASIQAGRAYNRAQDYQLQGYEKTATISVLNYLETLMYTSLSGYNAQQLAAQTAMYLTISIANGGAGTKPEVNGTITYNNDLGIIKAAEAVRSNIAFLAAETVAWYNNNYGGTVSSLASSGNVITTSANHNLSVNDPVIFTGAGVAGSGITTSTVASPTIYYVASVPSTTTFTITTAEGYLNSNTGSTYPTVSLTTQASPAMNVVYYFNVAGAQSDMTYILNAIVNDLQYTGNYKSLTYAQVLQNAIGGSAGSDMWHVRNGTTIRNFTMNGLTGLLTNPNSYGTKRITGGSYTSLDPGFGPNDSNSWIYSRSCYTQNCTMFGYGVAGAKVDGALHAGGYRSMVANDYTCIIGDGIGYWVTGSNSLAELVSVFNYYGYAGYLSELGARIRATNGNSSYGTYGVVAEGVDSYETPIYGSLNNRAFQAQITNVVTDGTNSILRFEYENAGSNYTNSVPSISGSGYNAAAVHDEFRDSSVFETRLIDIGTTSNPSVGGTNYVTTSNAAQLSGLGYITIAATDIALTGAYNGMRIQLNAGTGVGQVADILSYTNGSKVANVTRPSFATLSITSASSTNNLLTVASTASLYTGMPIYVGTNYAGLSAGTIYYVNSANFSATQFQVSTTAGGSGTAATITTTAGATVTVTATVAATNTITASNTLTAGQVVTFSSSFNGIDAGTLYYVASSNLSSSGFSVSTQFNGPVTTITSTGSASSTGTIGTAVYAVGWDHIIPGTPIVNNLDLTTTYIIEPKLWYTAPGYTATGRTLPATATWTSVAYGAGNYVAVASGGTATGYSTNGTTWTSGGALPSSTTWTSVVYGGGQLATATAVVGGFGGAGAVLQAVIGTGAYATQIVSINIINGGYNYTTPPTITITGGGGSGATAVATVLNGAIQSVTMSINGSGYTSTPTVTANTGIVSSVTVNNWGKNYYSTPTITFSQPQGLSPTAFALNTSVSLNAYLQTAAGRIYKVTQAGTTDSSTIPAFDYTSATYTNVANGTTKLTYIATQAQATANMTNAGVNSISLTQAGYGYTAIPTVIILDTTAKFVAISSATTAAGYSTVANLGSSWTSTVTNASSNQNFKSLAYGGGFYIAVGGASGTGTAASSSDGITWIARTPTALSSSAYYSSVTYGAGQFVAVANGLQTTTYSTNSGTSWTAGGNLPSGFTSAVSIAFGNNRFVVLGSDGKVATSVDKATTWVAAPTCTGTSTSMLSSSYTWTSVSYYQGLFLAIASGTTVCATSHDGITWSIQAMPSSSNWISAVGGSPISATLGAQPLWVAVSNTSGTVSASIRTGAKTSGRMKVAQASGIATEIRLIEPGSGYPKGNVSATTVSTNLITVDNTTNLSTSTANNVPIEFTGLDAYGLTSNTTYYIIGSTVTSTQFSVTAIAGSNTAVTLATNTGLSGTYRSGPQLTQVDPNRVTTAGTRIRMSDGALGNPTFTNRGTNNTTATASTTGDGYADIYQNSSYVNVTGLYSIPQAGANVQFSSITGNNQWYKLVTVVNILGIPGNYTAQFTINPSLTTLLAPNHGTLITTRLKYSQVRLTGHDFLYIGTGNQTQTNYPNVNPASAIQANQELQTGGGRVFFTSTDQDGNFNVGNLFGVQQSTGTATLNASAFNLAGLQSLTLGAVSLGVGSATITQFSTDPYFTANSDNILPTQKAIKSFITAQIGGGASSLNVNTLTSGQIYIANNSISNTTGNQIYVSSKMLFTGGIDGSPVALVFFGQR